METATAAAAVGGVVSIVLEMGLDLKTVLGTVALLVVESEWGSPAAKAGVLGAIGDVGVGEVMGVMVAVAALMAVVMVEVVEVVEACGDGGGF